MSLLLVLGIDRTLASADVGSTHSVAEVAGAGVAFSIHVTPIIPSPRGWDCFQDISGPHRQAVHRVLGLEPVHPRRLDLDRPHEAGLDVAVVHRRVEWGAPHDELAADDEGQ